MDYRTSARTSDQSTFPFHQPKKGPWINSIRLNPASIFSCSLATSNRIICFLYLVLPEVEADARYIQEQYYPSFAAHGVAHYKGDSVQAARARFLHLFNYQICDTEHRQAFSDKACQAAKLSSKPIYVFRELMHYLEGQRLVMPGYTSMQDIIGQALTHEQERLATILSRYLSGSDKENLNQLLEDSPGLYEITQLKREPKDFSAGEIKREIHRGEHTTRLIPSCR